MNLTTLNQSIIPQETPYKPRVLMSAKVYTDILTLVHNFQSEIGWQGYVRKQNQNTYVIEEILVYPQRVTGTTVEDDHEKFAAWIGQIPIDNLNRIRLYGHSHVNMSVYPSGTDLQQFETYKSQTDDFYIMMIVNKRNEFRIDIYDKTTDKHYVGCEYLISYDENKALLAEARRLVERKTFNRTLPTFPAAYHQWEEPDDLELFESNPHSYTLAVDETAKAYKRAGYFFKKGLK